MPNTSRLKVVLFATCVVFFTSLLQSKSNADLISTVDQQSAGTSLSLTLFTVGQSFTPSLPKIDAAEFMLRTFGHISMVQLDVIQGDGFTGPVLGQSSPIPVFGTSVSTFHFDLTSPVALSPGSPYTLRLRSLDANFFIEASTIDSYLGGTRYGAAGAAESGDLAFLEGLHPVPEASPILCIGSLTCFVFSTRRKRLK